MFTRISSLILSIFLFFIFYLSTSNIATKTDVTPNALPVFAAGLILLMIATTIINYKRLGGSWPHLMLACFYLLGVGSVFAITTNIILRIVFLAIAVVLFYFMEVNLGKESHFLQNIFLFSVFLIYIGIFAVQFYFHLNFAWLVLAIFLVSYLLIIQGFAGFSLPVKKYFNFLIALVCAEVAWGLSLWPTYYVVNALITFIVFYLLWIFSFSAFFGKLTKSKIYLQLSLALIVLILTLATANFKPLN